MASEQKGGSGPQAGVPEQEEWFDLLPVEKKLIAWSLGLGAALLALLVWMSYCVIPVPH
ncbi:MAG: hypothetical protein AB1503_02035 [Bacillota bacterium]